MSCPTMPRTYHTGLSKTPSSVDARKSLILRTNFRGDLAFKNQMILDGLESPRRRGHAL